MVVRCKNMNFCTLYFQAVFSDEKWEKFSCVLRNLKYVVNAAEKPFFTFSPLTLGNLPIL